MSSLAVLTNGSSLNPPKPKPLPFNRGPLKHTSSFSVPGRVPLEKTAGISVPWLFRSSTSRLKSFQQDNADEAARDNPEEQDKVAEILGDQSIGVTTTGGSFLAKLAIALGVAATITVISVGFKQPDLWSSFGIQCLAESSSSSAAVSPVGFTFKAFGYRFVLPEYAPGWVYFWLLMAAGCGLFISEEALNIWVCALYWLAYLWHACCHWMAHGSLSSNLSLEMLLT